MRGLWEDFYEGNRIGDASSGDAVSDDREDEHELTRALRHIAALPAPKSRRSIWQDEEYAGPKEEPAGVTRLREGLEREYGKGFQIQVSSDGRSAAFCRECRKVLVGDRKDRGVLVREIEEHRCRK